MVIAEPITTTRTGTPEDGATAEALTIVSLNLRGIHDSWWKREPLVVAGLAELSPDIVCLQEAATWCLQARWLAWRLSRRTGRCYYVAQSRKRGYRGIFEGLAVISAHPLESKRRLSLGEQGRIAQRVSASFEDGSLVVANAHLDHRGTGSVNRVAQAKRIARWLDGASPTVLCGDLNDRPESPALEVLTADFRSAHVEHGFEIKGTAPAWESGRVIDYILVSRGVGVVDAGTCLDRPVNGTWPSDHVGLWAKLRVPEA